MYPTFAWMTQWTWIYHMMRSLNRTISRVTGHLCEEFTGHRWIPPHKGQWRGALMFSSIRAWINGWVNNRESGDLRYHRAHYGVTFLYFQWAAMPPKAAPKKPPAAKDAQPEAGAATAKCRKQLNIPEKGAGTQTTVNVEKVVGWALQGKMGCDYPETSKIVRIFTSSTFTGKFHVVVILHLIRFIGHNEHDIYGQVADLTSPCNKVSYGEYCFLYCEPKQCRPNNTWIGNITQVDVSLSSGARAVLS